MALTASSLLPYSRRSWTPRGYPRKHRMLCAFSNCRNWTNCSKVRRSKLTNGIGFWNKHWRARLDKTDCGYYPPRKHSPATLPSILSECPDCTLLDIVTLLTLYEPHIFHSVYEYASRQGESVCAVWLERLYKDTGTSEHEVVLIECKGRVFAL